MSDIFYRAFEEKYRGSRDLIISRLTVYLEFVQPLLQVYTSGKVLDLGCGRGEWLELMLEQGFDALGVDLDDGMLQACRERNLNVENAEAISFLQDLPESSLCIVSGFHIAEHLPFEKLRLLVKEALRVLVPGGLLILETPNPENLYVGANSFYLDPTHQRPIPSGLLSFLSEYHGFSRWKVLRLQEDQCLKDLESLELIHVLKGVSPDYSVVSQKGGSENLEASMQEVFGRDFGLSLEAIASKFQMKLISSNDIRDKLKQALDVAEAAQAQTQQLSQQLAQSQLQVLEQERQAKFQLHQALSLVQVAQAQVQHLSNQLEYAQSQALEQERQANTQLQQTKDEACHWRLQADDLNKRLLGLYASTSWRLTSPLRFFKRIKSVTLKNIIMRFLSAPRSLPSFIRTSAKKLIIFAICYVNRSARLKILTLQMLQGMPSLAFKLQQIRNEQKLAAGLNGISLQKGVFTSAYDAVDPLIGHSHKLMTAGINAQQRSPLEAHFHTYVGRE